MPDSALPRTALALLKNDGSDSTTLYRTNIRAIGALLEASGALFAQGLLSARPTAGVQGRFYFATDTPTLVYYDNGSAWQTIGAGAASDGPAGTPTLRSLGSGSTQAAPGDSTAAGIAVAAAADLRDWCRPGLEVPGLVSNQIVVTAGNSGTLVAAPASGRRVVKSLLLASSTAGAVATITWAGLTLGTVYFTSAGALAVDVVLPQAATETLSIAAAGGDVSAVASYGDRADSVVTRLGYISSTAASATSLVGSGTARTVSMLWLANNSSSTNASASVTVAGTGGAVVVPPLVLPPRSLVVLDTQITLTTGQSITVTGDGANAVTYLAVGR